MIRQYSLAKDGNRKLAPSFNTREFRCRDGTDTILVDEALTVVLQCIREHFGKAVTITSGYRTPEHNAEVGGSKSSQHLLGRAADIRVQGGRSCLRRKPDAGLGRRRPLPRQGGQSHRLGARGYPAE